MGFCVKVLFLTAFSISYVASKPINIIGNPLSPRKSVKTESTNDKNFYKIHNFPEVEYSLPVKSSTDLWKNQPNHQENNVPGVEYPLGLIPASTKNIERSGTNLKHYYLENNVNSGPFRHYGDAKKNNIYNNYKDVRWWKKLATRLNKIYTNSRKIIKSQMSPHEVSNKRRTSQTSLSFSEKNEEPVNFIVNYFISERPLPMLTNCISQNNDIKTVLNYNDVDLSASITKTKEEIDSPTLEPGDNATLDPFLESVLTASKDTSNPSMPTSTSLPEGDQHENVYYTIVQEQATTILPKPLISQTSKQNEPVYDDFQSEKNKENKTFTKYMYDDQMLTTAAPANNFSPTKVEKGTQPDKNTDLRGFILDSQDILMEAPAFDPYQKPEVTTNSVSDIMQAQDNKDKYNEESIQTIIPTNNDENGAGNKYTTNILKDTFSDFDVYDDPAQETSTLHKRAPDSDESIIWVAVPTSEGKSAAFIPLLLVEDDADLGSTLIPLAKLLSQIAEKDSNTHSSHNQPARNAAKIPNSKTGRSEQKSQAIELNNTEEKMNTIEIREAGQGTSLSISTESNINNNVLKSETAQYAESTSVDVENVLTDITDSPPSNTQDFDFRNSVIPLKHSSSIFTPIGDNHPSTSDIVLINSATNIAQTENNLELQLPTEIGHPQTEDQPDKIVRPAMHFDYMPWVSDMYQYPSENLSPNLATPPFIWAYPPLPDYNASSPYAPNGLPFTTQFPFQGPGGFPYPYYNPLFYANPQITPGYPPFPSYLNPLGGSLPNNIPTADENVALHDPTLVSTDALLLKCAADESENDKAMATLEPTEIVENYVAKSVNDFITVSPLYQNSDDEDATTTAHVTEPNSKELTKPSSHGSDEYKTIVIKIIRKPSSDPDDQLERETESAFSESEDDITLKTDNLVIKIIDTEKTESGP